MYFARMHLKLSLYDVGDMELKQFYKGGCWWSPLKFSCVDSLAV
jgi:hypothetical protein